MQGPQLFVNPPELLVPSTAKLTHIPNAFGTGVQCMGLICAHLTNRVDVNSRAIYESLMNSKKSTELTVTLELKI